MKRAKRLKTKGIYFLFRILQAVGLPLLLLYFLYRAVRNRSYWQTLPQRFGFLPRSFRQTGPGAIWLHAVSVGEVVACVELVSRLRVALPHTRIFLSVSTLAGRATAEQKIGALADGIFFAPVDYVFAVRRVLRALQPSVVVVAETEIWPNLFREVKRTGAGLTLVNGRISDRAFPRYRPLRWFFEAVLPQADSVLAQTQELRARFLALGAPAERTRVSGNFKYDFEARPAAAESPVVQLIERLKPSGVWIAASTMPPAEAGDPDEDDVVIAAFQQLLQRHPGLLLILVPRKPERFDAAAQKLTAAGLAYVRRSQMDGSGAPQALLLDTIGELSGLFSVANVVFMGGTLPHRGGHNILEPAFFAKPVITGPHMENFQAIANEFRAADAVVEIASGSELAAAVQRMLASPAEARATGERALACAQARGGATSRALEEIQALHGRFLPHYRPAMPWYAVARALSWVWVAGGRRRFDSALRGQKKIDAPVISVGNLTMGGTGKTPCVLRLAELFKERGRKPAILTRGYKRASPEKYLALAPGAASSALQTGDEPQIFIRSGLAPVGIGADRYRTAMLLRGEFDVDLILMDDAFQHVRVARDVDIVLVDALNGFGGGEVFPVGRLREPMAALARADIFVITRAEIPDLIPAIEGVLRGANPKAPIFHAHVEPQAWVDQATGQSFDVSQRPFQAAAAFCAVGNPQSFRRTLLKLGVEPVSWTEFEDHHRYKPAELRRIAAQALTCGAQSLVTTQKDAVNLCDDAEHLFGSVPVYWLKVGMRIDREDDFVYEIMQRLI
ncbi:MAG TPA: tetraacyldisaccharide 4'-kinase [Candidatus Sulfopaludibacter sp.]|jgi:tetraacyldisaccharide 4'-kinase|nr:tetraacyldisaccharide 4'-kinase [Candidatus Sulfopaludibacter sp.]